MSGNLPNPDNISVNEILNLIENIPEKKRKRLLSHHRMPRRSPGGGNLPNPKSVRVDQLVNLIENLPEKKRKKLLSQISGDFGNNQEM